MGRGPLAYLGAPSASDTVEGVVELATVAETVTGTNTTKAVTPAGVAAVAIAGAPAASTSQAGIIEIATNTEAGAKVASNLALVPSNIPSIMAEPGAIGGSTPAAGAFTTLSASTSVTADVTGAIALDADVASNLSVDGAGIDLTLASGGGRVVVNGEEAAADALRLVSAAGGLDVDVALQMSLVSSQNAASAIVINASAGGIDMTAAGAAGEDIDLVNTAGSINLTAGESVADAIVLSSSAGGIDISAGGGDLDVTATGAGINITSTENAADAIYLRANGGTSETIRIHADQGTGVASVSLLSDVGGVTITGGVASADAVNIVASNAAGGIDIDAGTNGIIADTTGAISLDSAAASNFTVTGAFDLTLASSAGSVNINAGESAADSIRIASSAGGIDILATGAAAGEDIDIIATGSSVNITATEAVADAIVLNSSNAAGGIDLLTGGGEITIGAVGGNVTMLPGTQSAAGTSLTLSARVGVATFTGQTTAAGSTITLTITNSALGAGGGIFCTVSNKGSNDAQMSLTRVNTETAGTLIVQARNNGAAALNGDIIVTFWIIN